MLIIHKTTRTITTPRPVACATTATIISSEKGIQDKS